MMVMTQLSQLEQAAGDLPLLGHAVVWRLGDVSVDADYLANLLNQAGFGKHAPEPPTPRMSLKRAIQNWVKNRSGLSSMQSESANQRGLIRTINSGQAAYLAFVLVREDVDFRSIGLDYNTEIKFLLDKKTNDLIVATNLTSERQEALSTEIRALWSGESGRLHHTDISAAIRECVGELGAVSLHPRGGVYFVPRTQGRLQSLKQLVESLAPSAMFTTIEIADGPKGRIEMTRVVQQGLIDEVNALASDLDRMVDSSDPETRRESTVVRRLAEYRKMEKKVSDYRELMGIYTDGLNMSLCRLSDRARALLAA